MKDINNVTTKLGDRISLSSYDTGVVVCDLDGSEYSDAYPQSGWSYLKVGIMVETDQAGLMHLIQDNVEPEAVQIIT